MLYKPDTTSHICNPRTQQVETGGTERHPWLHCEGYKVGFEGSKQKEEMLQIN